LNGAGHRDEAGARNRTGEPGKVIPYEDFLRARAARESAGAQSGSAPAPSPTEAGAETRSGPAVSPATFETADATRPSPAEPGPAPDALARRVEQVRARIRDGYYERPEILEETVQRILSSMRPESNPPTPGRAEP
jgi:hypothetical protein